jgi:hypothetical protein
MDMLSAHHIAWEQMHADRAFRAAKRRRVREALVVHDQTALARRTPGGNMVREIPLAAIVGTFDAGRARDFDRGFRPLERTRKRWLRVFGADSLPPITVMQMGNEFAVVDGHHRVSVALARGATTITAVIA